ncbi:MAG: translation initiation factor eIF4E [Amphiamblys sp. WSBS2006]|nr:MAG: translation initiation factor eIF4E [Amphiamblys sp. WSBS2006]
MHGQRCSSETEECENTAHKGMTPAAQEEELVTIFADPDAYNTKHLLNMPWKFFYTRPMRDWGAGVVYLNTVDTLEDFVIFLKRLDLVGLEQYYAINLFREHSKPEWEDKTNKEGSRTRITVTNPEESSSIFWAAAVLAVGESFGKTGAYVNGVRIECKGDFRRVELWYSKDIRKQDVEEIHRALERETKVRIKPTDFCLHVDPRRRPRRDDKSRPRNFEKDTPYGK